MTDIVCTICGDNSVSVLVGRDDREYGVNSRLNYFQCANDYCRHVHANPVPCNEVIESFYLDYTTHNIYRPRGLGRFVNFLSELIADSQVNFLCTFGYDTNKTRILDFGCGNGNNLRRLSRLGYSDLVGFDFDPHASACVLDQGFICYSKWDDVSKEGDYDVVFLNHVIEHLPNPRSSLTEIFEVIRPGGLLVIRTPNARSFLARMCGSNWRGWETPRHLNIFTYGSLYSLLNGISDSTIVQSTTSNAMSFALATSSTTKNIQKHKVIKLVLAFFLTIGSHVFKFFINRSGEELVFKIKKN
jgi:2-polyprenyl-3-methyl-5-hydroxy-6-metoxy-1,4-benzoquinol methylase